MDLHLLCTPPPVSVCCSNSPLKMAGMRHISFQVSLFVYMKCDFYLEMLPLSITCWSRLCWGGCRLPLTAEEHSVQGQSIGLCHWIKCFPKYFGFSLWVPSASAPLVHCSVMDATWSSHWTASLRDTHNSTICCLLLLPSVVILYVVFCFTEDTGKERPAPRCA